MKNIKYTMYYYLYTHKNHEHNYILNGPLVGCSNAAEMGEIMELVSLFYKYTNAVTAQHVSAIYI